MIERYDIIKLISKDPAGGMYLAQDNTLERKVVFRHIDSDPDMSRPDTWSEEFAAYSGKLCALQHPNLLTIYDVDVDDDGVSVVTQYVEGESLAERLERGPLPQMGAYRMVTDLLEALHAAHASDLFHGALHTGSIKRLPRATGGHRYLLVDLGLNTLATMIKGEDVHIADPVLLAPELHDEETAADARSDLFMLGQLCYTALAGGHPFAGKTPEECAQSYQADGLPPLKQFAPDVQEDFAAWISKLSNGDPAQRPATAKAAMDALQQIVIDEPEPKVPGQTRALVEIPSEPARNTTATVAVASQRSQEVTPHQDLSVGTPNSRKPMVVIAVLCGLIVVALAFALLRNGDDPSDDGKDALAAIPEGAAAHMFEPVIINTMASKAKPVSVSLDTAKSLDWTVVTGKQAELDREDMADSTYIQSINMVGFFAEGSADKSPVTFTYGDDTMMVGSIVRGGIAPAAHKPANKAPAKRGKKGGARRNPRKPAPLVYAKPGDGYEVMLRMPKSHKGPVLLSIYMRQQGCDYAIELGLPGDSTESFQVPATEPGMVKIPLVIAEARPGGFYTVKITATPSGQNDHFIMGMGAIHVTGY